MSASPPAGILPVDKPVGPTSHDIVARARRGLGTRRVGHTGTLDPFASGLLLLCVGTATRLSPFLTGLDKGYEAEALLGVSTDTFDREGSVVAERGGGEAVSDERIRAALRELTGPLEQVPPAFSAKKVRGEAAHRRVRRGEAVVLSPVPVAVRRFELLGRRGAVIRLGVTCSSGTYVRSLARDLGEILETGAHLTALRRTTVGPFRISEAVSGEAFDAVLDDAWITPADALARAGMPHFETSPEHRVLLAQGRTVPCDLPAAAYEDGPVAAVHGGELLAVGESTGGRFQPRRVFVAS